MRVRVLIEMDDGGVGVRAVNVLDAAMRAYNEKLSRAVPDAAIDFEVLGVVPDADVRAGVAAEEPEWEYGWRSRFATGGPVFQELEWGSREQAEQSIRDHELWEADDPEESRLVYELVKRTPAVRAGEWVPVKQEGADGD